MNWLPQNCTRAQTMQGAGLSAMVSMVKLWPAAAGAAAIFAPLSLPTKKKAPKVSDPAILPQVLFWPLENFDSEGIQYLMSKQSCGMCGPWVLNTKDNYSTICTGKPLPLCTPISSGLQEIMNANAKILSCSCGPPTL